MDQKTSSNTGEQAIVVPHVRLMLFGIVTLALGYSVTLYWDTSANLTYIGYIHAPVTQVNANTRGEISDLLVDSGEAVQVGQPLFDISDQQTVIEAEELRERVNSLMAELDQKKAAVEVDLAWRMKNIQAEVLSAQLKSADYMKAQFDEQIRQQAWKDYVEKPRSNSEQAQEIFQSISHTWEAAEDDRLKALLNKESAQNAIEVSTVQINLVEDRLKYLEALEQQLPGQVRRAHGIDQLEKEVQSVRGTLAKLENTPRVQSQVSPQYGQIGLCRKTKGDLIGQYETVLEIIDREQTYLTVQIPTRDVTCFEEGDEVELIFPGDDVRFGRVQQIPAKAQTTSMTGEYGQQDTVLKLTVAPIQKLWPAVPLQTAVLVRKK